MLLISQQDKRWGNVKIGRSKVDLMGNGCTITSLCMISSKFTHPPYLPDEGARNWVFDLRGRIIWTRTKFRGFEFVWRAYTNNFDQIKQYANDPNKAVILHVNGSHWVAVKEVVGEKIVIHDPWDGKEYDNLPRKYKIVGYALFKKTLDVPDWSEEACGLARAAGLPSDNLKEEMTVELMQEDLEALKKIDRVMAMPRYRWYEVLRKMDIL